MGGIKFKIQISKLQISDLRSASRLDLQLRLLHRDPHSDAGEFQKLTAAVPEVQIGREVELRAAMVVVVDLEMQIGWWWS